MHLRRLRHLCTRFIVLITLLSFINAQLQASFGNYASSSFAQAQEDTAGSSLSSDLSSDFISEGNRDKEVQKSQVEAEHLIQQIESAGPSDLPKNTRDSFHLTKQKLEIGRESYNLSQPNVVLPLVSVTDFDSSVVASITANGSIRFEYRRKDKVIAAQTIEGLEAVKIVQDKELLHLIDKDGNVKVIDLVFARSALFTRPLPVFHLVKLPDSQLSNVSELSLEFITRGSQPSTAWEVDAILPEEVKTESLLHAGDLHIYRNDDGVKKTVALLDRSVTLTEVFTGNAALAFLSYTVAPDEKLENTRDNLLLARDAEVRKKIEKVLESKDDPVIRNALLSFDEKSIETLREKSVFAKSKLKQTRDEFYYQEWLTSFEKIQANAKVLGKEESLIESSHNWKELLTANPEIAKEQNKSTFYRLLHSKGLRTVAAASLGVAATAYGANELVTGHGPEWAVHIVQSLYQNYWPEVLRQNAYRMTLLKSTLSLSSFIPILYGIGVLTGKSKGWDFRKSLSTYGLRAYAFMQLPFFATLATRLRQPVLVAAMHNGVNPFQKDEGTGTRVGVNSPFLSKEKLALEVSKKSQFLSEILSERKSKKALAWVLSHAVVCEEFGIDPATLLLAEETPGEDLERKLLAGDPVLLEKWNRLSKELYYAFQDKNLKLPKNIAELKKEEIAEFYEIAKETAERIKGRSKLEKVAANLRLRWKKFTSGQILKEIGDYGVKEYEFLKTAEASEFVYTQTWRQFWLDYAMGTVQMGVVGERANLSKPQDLAALDNGIAGLWTNPAHLADMGEQVALYGISVPAAMALTYGDQIKKVTDLNYEPLEKTSLKGIERPEYFFKSIQNWGMHAVNVKEADYGHYFLKSITRKIKTMQAGFIMYAACRKIFASQAFSKIVPTFIYSNILWGVWSYSWIWQPINRGMQLQENAIEAQNIKLMDAKIKISQGIRKNNAPQWQEGYRELLSMYSLESASLPSELKVALKAAAEVLQISPTEFNAATQSSAQLITESANLTQAIASQDEARISEAKARLLALYAGSDVEVRELDAESLLNFSLAHPPFFTKVNAGAQNFITISGAVSTTYLATSLLVTTYQNLPWGEKLLSAGVTSALLYASVWYAQKVVNNVHRTLKYVRMRAEVPYQAFVLASEQKPHFQTLAEYAGWMKQNPNAPELVKKATVEVLAKVLEEEGVDLTKINRAQFTLEEVGPCAAKLKPGEYSVKPLTRSEKFKQILKGAFIPPH